MIAMITYYFKTNKLIAPKKNFQYQDYYQTYQIVIRYQIKLEI